MPSLRQLFNASMSVVAEGRVVTDVGCLRTGQYPRTERCAKISRMVKAEEAKGISSSLMPDYAGGWVGECERIMMMERAGQHNS